MGNFQSLNKENAELKQGGSWQIRMAGHPKTYWHGLPEDLPWLAVVFLLNTGMAHMSHKYLPSGSNLQRSQ